MITDGITNANINSSKYLFIIDDGDGDVNVDVDDDVDPAILATLWILNPKINDDVPIRKETTTRIFCVIAGMRTIGAPWLVCCARVCSAAVVFVWSSINVRGKNKIVMTQVTNNICNMIKRVGNDLIMISSLEGIPAENGLSLRIVVVMMIIVVEAIDVAVVET
jgi:hypothetical protein